MRVANVMFSRGLGGIEQAFVDYARALTGAGWSVLNVTRPAAAIISSLNVHGLQHTGLPNLGGWDLLAAWRLRRLLKRERIDIAVAHGNRAAALLVRAAHRRLPVIGVTHNYSLKHFRKLDGVLTLTPELFAHAMAQGVPRDRLRLLPNMVEVPPAAARPDWRTPPVIGSMGRMVEKKGFAVFIEALSLLHQRGLAFRAILGGDGALKETLKEQARMAGIGDILHFSGWVEDKRAFFDSIDLFCLPSLHEPFGIVLLEAFAHAVPAVTTASEGPSAIVTPGEDALAVPCNDATALANALSELLTSRARAGALGAAGYATVSGRYSLPVVACQLDAALRSFLPAS